MLYNIFDSRHMSNFAADFQKEKRNVYRNSQVSKQRKKNIKNGAAQPYLESCQISMMERFCENTTIKSFIAYV